MTQSERRKTYSVWVVLSALGNPATRIQNVDWLTVLLAVLLPWSTTGVLIVSVIWIFALSFTLAVREFLQSLARPISALPIAMFALALVGTLWSDAAWGTRLAAISPTTKLLLLPLLFYHFSRSRHGEWVFVAFLCSCTLIMAASWLVALVPALSLKSYLSLGPFAPANGIVVKNYIDQSQELALCAIALAYPVMALVRANRMRFGIVLALIALSFLANMIFVVVSRTTLVVLPFMLIAFALRHLQLRSSVTALCIAVLVAVLGWNGSPNLRNTAWKFYADYDITASKNELSGMGSRLEYWRKSLSFVVDAPVVGHGTGSTRGLFERAAVGETGIRAEVVSNPHNQTLAVAVQWGAIGVVILYAMWIAHLLLFRGDSLAACIGLLVVVQNVLTSLLNSHLFDFQEGWIYVLGVGVSGGMILGARRDRISSGAPEVPKSTLRVSDRSGEILQLRY
jgi:O-antigen ligase